MIDLKLREKEGSKVERLMKSSVQTNEGALILVHHATKGKFDPSDLAPFSHFGTRDAARQRIYAVDEGQGDIHSCRLISAFLDIRAPLLVEDVDDAHNVEHFIECICNVMPQVLTPDEIVDLYDMETGQAEEYLRSTLLEHGIDGLCYINRHEDPGSMSWVILDPSQIILQRAGPLAGSRDPWELSEEEFTGPLIESDVFEIDGLAEDYEHLWEDLHHCSSGLPVLSHENGWEARWLPDWEPAATMGLYDPSGVPRGFYMAGQLWIDEAARGSGLSSLLINAAADLLGNCPAQNSAGMGFSHAGAAAHRSARRKAIAGMRNGPQKPDGMPDLSPGEAGFSTEPEL